MYLNITLAVRGPCGEQDGVFASFVWKACLFSLLLLCCCLLGLKRLVSFPGRGPGVSRIPCYEWSRPRCSRRLMVSLQLLGLASFEAAVPCCLAGKRDRAPPWDLRFCELNRRSHSKKEGCPNQRPHLSGAGQSHGAWLRRERGATPKRLHNSGGWARLSPRTQAKTSVQLDGAGGCCCPRPRQSQAVRGGSQ